MPTASMAYDLLADQLTKKNIDVEGIKAALKRQCLETPSWGYSDSGTRFRVFPWPGAARNVFERLSDAAFIHGLTGIASRVALHIGWDTADDWNDVRQFAEDLGLSIGAINPNTFQDEAYKLGSVCHPSGWVRRKALDHMIACCRVVELMSADVLSVWLADGTNYPGQDDMCSRKHRLEEGLAEVYSHLPRGARMLIEYKPFEPAFYHTDLADWGMSFNLCRKLGPQAQVLVDMGHHALGTNIAQIVAYLLDEDRLGGFHFNARQYADDDLIVGSVNPWELFTVYHELISAGPRASHVAQTLDQSHNVEPKLEAMLISVLNCQSALAKALLVNRRALCEAQESGEMLSAHLLLKEAFETDVRPLLEQVRQEMDCPADPIAALRADPYPKRIAEQRSPPETSNGPTTS